MGDKIFVIVLISLLALLVLLKVIVFIRRLTMRRVAVILAFLVLFTVRAIYRSPDKEDRDTPSAHSTSEQMDSDGGKAGESAADKIKSIPGGEEFLLANKLIMTNKGDVIAHGNSTEAQRLAASFSSEMSDLQRDSFSGGPVLKGVLTGNKFLTYCHLSNDTAVFLVHVPDLRSYKGEARASLMGLAWLLAHKLVTKADYPHIKEIGVGLRGVLQYGALTVGKVGEAPVIEIAERVAPKPLVRLFAGNVLADGGPKVPVTTDTSTSTVEVH